MTKHSIRIPQLDGGFFLTDGGLETDLMFNHGVEIPEFAAHTLLADSKGREAMANYFRGFLSLARDMDAGYILDSQTWKAHMHWADALGANEAELRAVNHASVDMIVQLRKEFSDNAKPIVLNAVIGPQGDAYAPEAEVAAHQAEEYHSKQIGWLAETPVDMVTALTFTQSDEAIGLVRAAVAAKLPVVVSFTVETEGDLPTGQPLSEAITAVDEATDSAAAYFMVNCAHPDHFLHVLEDDQAWASRIRGVRANASRKSHAELDESTTLDDGNPDELAAQYQLIGEKLPNLNVYGGCCGSDLRHVVAIANAMRS